MNKQQFGSFIAENRKAAGLTQRALAERLHVTDKAVSKWERALSYPDVTLLEPLAEALGLGVEELMACRRLERKREEEPVQNLLEISRESLQRERQKKVWQIFGVALAVSALALAAMWQQAAYVHEQRTDSIILKETVGGTDYIYVEEEGHLVRLKCGGSVDAEQLELTDEWGNEIAYKMDCRWNRRTYEGSVSACASGGSLCSVENMLGASLGLDYPLFGYRDVWSEYTYGYHDPSLGEVYTFTFWAKEAGERKNLLKVRQCLAYTQEDWDQDGKRELLVRTRWQEKPYTVYDLEDGVIQASWPDDLSPELKERLITDQERYERLQANLAQMPEEGENAPPSAGEPLQMTKP